MSLRKFLVLSLRILFVVSSIQNVFAEPYVPGDDNKVLEYLRTYPTDPASRELRQLRAQLVHAPNDLELATRLARHYIEQGRSEADPRYYGYAEAALKPWWNQPSPPVNVLVLRATLRQARHDFSGALNDLSQALNGEPTNSQAWITKALIEQAQGDYPSARRSCLSLLRLTSPLIVGVCAASVTSLTGQAGNSYRTLLNVLQRSHDASPTERLWVLTVLAEIAQRSGNAQAAEGHYKEALQLNVRDPYLLAAYADFLLDLDRPGEVATLLKNETRADGLLLRLTLAEQALDATGLNEHIEALRARFAASRLRGDTVHRREEARFTLHLLNQPQQALQLAEENWRVQREPADARIVLEASLAAHNPYSARDVLDWLMETRIEDVQLAVLAKQLKGLTL